MYAYAALTITRRPDEYRFEGKTAAEWRARAHRSEQDAHESWERSDTDGFLSQWASNQMATRYLRLARIAEAGGRVEVYGFVDIETGEIIRGDWRPTQHGSGYAPADRSRSWIFPSEAKNPEVRARNNAKKGVRTATLSAPAVLNHRSYDVYPDVDSTDWYEITD